MKTEKKKAQGFNVIDPKVAREIQSMGGSASPSNLKYLSKKRRSEIARAGGLNRWKNKKV